jgi:hypothetical protein
MATLQSKRGITTAKSWRTIGFDERSYCKLFLGKRSNRIANLSNMFSFKCNATNLKL